MEHKGLAESTKLDNLRVEGELHPTTTDDARLEEIGFTEELERKFTVWSLAALVLCLMGTWEAVGSTMAQALIGGGAPCLIYNYIWCFLGSLCSCYSLAELGSIYPTAGAQYHWVAGLAPEKSRKTASWFTGWICLGAATCGTASAAYLAGTQIQGIISLCDDTYVPKPWHGVLLYFAVLAYSVGVNIWGSGPLSTINLAAGILHLTGYVAIIVTVGVMSNRQSSYFVFQETANLTGWPNDGLAWMIGGLTTAYAFLGYDAAAHLAEEIPHASRNVPLAMVGSTIVNGIFGFAYSLILMYGVSTVPELLESRTGFPFIQLYYDATQHKAGASIMALVPTLIAMAGNAAGLAATSRTFWAFARDKGMPCSDFFAVVNPRFRIPLRVVLFVTVLEIALGLISLGSTTALTAVLSMATTSVYLSYVLPICYMLRARYRRTTPPFGSFRMLPTVGWVINILAVAYLVVVMFFSTWPITYPVTRLTMNYDVVVLAGWLIIGSGFYLLRGRHQYNNPISNVTTFHQ